MQESAKTNLDDALALLADIEWILQAGGSVAPMMPLVASIKSRIDTAIQMG
jgi:hypothetical protein